jgi:transposase InsO family protein
LEPIPSPHPLTPKNYPKHILKDTPVLRHGVTFATPTLEPAPKRKIIVQTATDPTRDIDATTALLAILSLAPPVSDSYTKHECEEDVHQALNMILEIGGAMTQTCIDTGAGANVISKKFLASLLQGVAEIRILERPKEVLVANSRSVYASTMAKVSITLNNVSYPLWWLVLDELPVTALIGFPSMKRLGLYPNTQTMKLMLRNDPVSDLNKGFTSYPGPVSESYGGYQISVFSMKTYTLPPHKAVAVDLIPGGKIDSPQGYFTPKYSIKGKLIAFPGLFEFKSTGQLAKTTVLFLNPTNIKMKIKKDTKLGKVYLLSESDAISTLLIEMGDKSLLDFPEPPVKPQTIPPHDDVPFSPNSCNAKCGANYMKALPDSLINRMVLFMQIPLNPLAKGRMEQSIESTITEQAILAMSLGIPPVKHPDPPDHLKGIFEEFRLGESNLTLEQKIKFAEMLGEFKHIYDKDKREGPQTRTTATEMKIDSTGPSLASRVRRTTPNEDVIVWEHIEKMHNRRVIRPSTSPWAAPILLADKKNGNVRFCVDYRQLNSVTKKDMYPLPRMDEILPILGNASFFSTIDLTDAFWSIPIREEDIEKTAFISKHGLWEFISMPFGLTNAPSTQQRFIEAVLQGLIFKCCFAYIDDIICYSTSFEQHLDDLRSIFTKLSDNDLQLQPKKCAFCRPSFEILGFITTPDGLKPNPKKVEAIQNFPEPKSPKEVDRFLGMVTWLRRFIPHSSGITANLRIGAKMEPRNFVLSPKAKKEFQLLREILTSDTCMMHPNLSKPFYIHVDASKHALGAILTQLDENGNHRVVEYASKVLSKTQRNYSNPVREALGILWALNVFKYYVLGRHPVVYSDCKCLYELVKPGAVKIPNHAMLRDWIARILQYDPSLLHKPGKLMAIPDALSRHFVAYDDNTPDPLTLAFAEMLEVALSQPKKVVLEKQRDILRKINSISEEEDPVPPIRTFPILPTDSNHPEEASPTHYLPKLASAQRLDRYCRKLINYLQFGKLPKRLSDLKVIKASIHKFWIDKEGILRKIDETAPADRGPPAVLPRALWDETLDAHHTALSGGHRKFKKLFRLIADSYFFPGMSSYIAAYCRSCLSCLATTKSKQMTNKLVSYYASYPGITVHIDNTGGPNKTVRGNEYLCAIVDSFSGYIRLYPIPNPSAAATAKVLMEFIAVNSMPLKIITDNGPEFSNELYAELMALLGLKQVFITPYNSKGNGKVETTHETTKGILRNYVKEHHDDWDLLIPLVEFAMNTSVSSATTYTPFYIHFGRHPIMPLDAIYESVYRPMTTTTEYVKKLQSEREKVINWIREQREKVSEVTARRYNEAHKHTMTTLYPGDWVLLKSDQKKETESMVAKKYRDLYSRNIWIVMEDMKNGSYRVRRIENALDEKTMNINRFKRIKMRYEVNIHPHLEGISSDAVMEEEGSDDEDCDNDHNTAGLDEGDDYDAQVFKVLGHRETKDGMYYKLQLKGYTQKSALWYPEHAIDCEDLIQAYHHAKQVERPIPASKTQSLEEQPLPEKSKSTKTSAPAASPPQAPTPPPSTSLRGRMRRPNVRTRDL